MRNYHRFFFCFVIVPVLFFSGACSKPGQSSNTVAVVGRVPVIDLPVKPTLESLDADELIEYAKLPVEVRRKLQLNDKKLKTYAEQLRVGIEDYNTYAAVRNKASEDAVGVIKGSKQ